jgi:membrane protein implicated in regulation of membrane protease activity
VDKDTWTNKYKGARVVFIILGLTVLFFFDDVLLVFLAEKIDFFKANRWIYSLLLLWFFLISLGLAYAVFHIMKKRPTTGLEAIQGQVGRVLSKSGELYRVSFHGEIWNAECKDALKTGERVKIVSVNGLMLHVTPLKDELHDS